MYTLKTAQQFSKQGKIEEWIHLFLNGEGNNIEFSKGLKLQNRHFYGPVVFELSRLKRCCGPELHNKFVMDETFFNQRVERIIERHKTGWDMPPLIIEYTNNELTLCDGNHRFEALVRQDKKTHNIIVWSTFKSDIEDFIKKYGQEVILKEQIKSE